MAVRGLSLLLLLLCISPSVISFHRGFFPIEVARQHKEFDYFVLALQWPATMCRRVRHCCSSNGCCNSPVPLLDFTIHGLWPNYNDGSWPSCCSRSDFDITKISSLIGELQKYWPSFSCSSTSLCHGGKGLFWAHEWEKHGTCSSPVVNDEYDFFSTVLDLYSKYNVTKILDTAGFVASNAYKYATREVIAAVENAMGASPLLVCSQGAVKELRMCFDKNLKPRDCAVTSHIHSDALSRRSCPKHISFPSYTRIDKGENSTITWLADNEGSKIYLAL